MVDVLGMHTVLMQRYGGAPGTRLFPRVADLLAGLEHNGLEFASASPHNAAMVVIPTDRKRFGRGFDSRHLHHGGVYWLRQGDRWRAGDPRGDGRNPRKTTNANDERFALAA